MATGATPTASPSPSPKGGAGGAVDIFGALTAWVVTARYLPKLLPLLSALRTKVEKGAKDLREWFSNAFGATLAPWGWLVSLVLGGVAYSSHYLLDWTLAQYATLPDPIYVVVVKTGVVAAVVAGLSAFIQIVAAIVKKERIAVFLIGCIATSAALLVHSVTYLYYSLLLGKEATALSFVDMAEQMWLARYVLTMGAGLVFIALAPIYLILRFVAWALATAIFIGEGGVGTFLGIAGPAYVPGMTVTDFKSIVDRVHEAIDEKGLRSAIDMAIPSIAIALIWFFVMVLPHVHPTTAKLVIFAALISELTGFYASARGNGTEVTDSKKRFALFVYTTIGIASIAWIALESIWPEFVPGAISAARSLPAGANYVSCMTSGMTSHLWKDKARIFSLLTVPIVFGTVAAIIFAVWWKHPPKNFKAVGWNLAGSIGICLLALLAFFANGWLFLDDRFVDLAAQGCPVGGTKTVVATPAATPASTTKLAPGKTGLARPVTDADRRAVKADQDEAAALGL